MVNAVISTELTKLRRSVVPWATLAVILAAPWMIALLMWIVREPARAASLGLLGTKANLAGLEATWPAYLGYLAIVVGASGMVLLAFIVSYVFGREYLDQTSKTLFTLPVRREWFAAGKLMIAAGWWLSLVIAALLEGIVIGGLLGLPGLTVELLVASLTQALALAGVSFLLCPAAAWITVATRNMVAPIGFAIGMLLLGDLLSHTGWAGWFPWSVLFAMTGALTTPNPDLPVGGIMAAVVIFAVGSVATALQVRWADNP